MVRKKEYTVRQAASEGWAAIRTNLISLVVAFASTVALSAFIALLLILVAFLVFLQFDDLNAAAILLASIGVCIGVAIIVFLQAFINNVTSLAFADGLQGHKSNVGNLIKNGFKAMTRVAKTYVILLLVIVGPLLLVGLFAAILSISGLDGAKLVLAVAGFTAWLCWAVIAGLRYALAPLVSLFEPKIKPLDALNRSYHLMKQGGMWFLVKAVLLVMALNILLSLLTGNSDSPTFGTPDNTSFTLWSFLVNVVSLALSLVAQAAFVAFYFNRVKVRKKS